MSSDHFVHLYLYWFWTAFFVLFGVFYMTRGRRYLAACTADCNLKLQKPDNGALARVEAAVERRQEAEGAPVQLGLWMGSFCFVLAAAAATGRVQPALLYAFMCFGMAAGIAFVFLRVRNSQPRRVAVLSARSVDSVIPSYWFYAAVASAVGILTYATNVSYRDAAMIVSLSSLITVILAWRLANLPSLLTGVDIPAEQLVDDRLRSYRSRAAMVFALVQTFVFCTQAIGEATVPQLISYWLTTVLWVAFGAWMLRRQFAPVRLA